MSDLSDVDTVCKVGFELNHQAPTAVLLCDPLIPSSLVGLVH